MNPQAGMLLNLFSRILARELGSATSSSSNLHWQWNEFGVDISGSNFVYFFGTVEPSGSCNSWPLKSLLKNCLWLWKYAELVTLVDIISTVLDLLWIADPVSAKRRIFNSRWSICCLNLNCCCNLWKEEIFFFEMTTSHHQKKRLKFVASLSAYTTHQIKDTQQQRKVEVFYKIW